VISILCVCLTRFYTRFELVEIELNKLLYIY